MWDLSCSLHLGHRILETLNVSHYSMYCRVYGERKIDKFLFIHQTVSLFKSSLVCGFKKMGGSRISSIDVGVWNLLLVKCSQALRS